MGIDPLKFHVRLEYKPFIRENTDKRGALKLLTSQKRLGPSFIDTWKYLLSSQKASPVALVSPWLSRYHVTN